MKRKTKLLALILCAVLVFVFSSACLAEEETDTAYAGENGEEEGEFIPEDYYDPIETNELYAWPQGPAVQAASAIVMDMDTDAVLYGKNLDETHYPASITKIMTTLVALENSSLEDTFTCGEEVYQIEADSTNLGIKSGEKLTMAQALSGVMLESANDLANAVAVHVAGSISAFAEMMNAKAAQLGCTHTHFVNPSGLHDENHYTTVRDMAKIAKAAYGNPQFREITAKTEYVIPKTNVTDEERGFLNHHKLLQPDSEYYQSWCTGGKTGFTTDAWNTLVTFGEKDGKRLVCVLLRENGADKAYTETTDLMNYGFGSFQKVVMEDARQVPDFYQLLDLDYPNAGTTVIQTDSLKQKVMTQVEPGTVTIPIGFEPDALTARMGADGRIQYTYRDWPVGQGAVSFIPVPTGITLSYEQPRDMETILAVGAEKRRANELTQTAITAWTGLKERSLGVYESARSYVKNNTMTVALIGALVLFFLFLMIVVLIMRCTKEARIRRKRRAEERSRLRSAEDIDRMSAVEIEQQLREAMDRERQIRAREEEKRKKQEEEEEKLRETEEILEQISQKK